MDSLDSEESRISLKSLKSVQITDAVVMPIYPPSLRDMRAGVFDAGGQLLQSSLLLRDAGYIIGPATSREPEEFLSGEYIFGGYLFDHFGHFLLESCQRLWFAKHYPGIPIVWALGSRLQTYQEEIFKLLGLRNKNIFIAKPTKVAALHLPDPAYRIQTYCSPEMVDLMGQWEGDLVPGRKTWVSRSTLPESLGKVYSEKRLEERLAQVGWNIFHPQRHSIGEQLATYSSSEHLAGFAGSAFHSLILLKDYRGKISLFERGSPLNLNYATIANAKNLNQTIYQIEMEQGSKKGYMTSYSLPSATKILNNLVGPAEPYNPPTTRTYSSRRINTLVEKLSYKTYLEIGVALGETFLNAKIETKRAVDPNFRFDYRSVETQNVRFYEIPSDEYFSHHVKQEKFDLVFLDGLHTFEQTFRDFCNALTATHDRSIIIIDDTIPSDVYSSWPNQAEAVRFRAESGGKGGAWHGDVFKTVFAIHDFFPTLSYLTINTEGNPQTLIWREPRTEFRPLFNSLETISRLSWFDLRKNIECLNRMTEQQGLEHAMTRVLG